jgi:addiction module RelE/StbE family toxin
MRIVWTILAADDLQQISDFLYQQNLSKAPELVRRIYDSVSTLKKFPYAGRSGKKSGTRELIISGLPYLAVYEIAAEEQVES